MWQNQITNFVQRILSLNLAYEPAFSPHSRTAVIFNRSTTTPNSFASSSSSFPPQSISRVYSPLPSALVSSIQSVREIHNPQKVIGSVPYLSPLLVTLAPPSTLRFWTGTSRLFLLPPDLKPPTPARSARSFSIRSRWVRFISYSRPCSPSLPILAYFNSSRR
jgi:hypothetical protein